jgi:hypothetical protein
MQQGTRDNPPAPIGAAKQSSTEKGDSLSLAASIFSFAIAGGQPSIGRLGAGATNAPFVPRTQSAPPSLSDQEKANGGTIFVPEKTMPSYQVI